MTLFACEGEVTHIWCWFKNSLNHFLTDPEEVKWCFCLHLFSWKSSFLSQYFITNFLRFNSMRVFDHLQFAIWTTLLLNPFHLAEAEILKVWQHISLELNIIRLQAYFFCLTMVIAGEVFGIVDANIFPSVAITLLWNKEPTL